MTYEEEDHLIRRLKNDRTHRFQHGCLWDGFIMKLIDDNTNLKHLEEKIHYHCRGYPNLPHAKEPYHIPQYFIEYSMDKNERWLLKEKPHELANIDYGSSILQDHSCYRILCDRIHWSKGYPYTDNVIHMWATMKNSRMQKYEPDHNKWLPFNRERKIFRKRKPEDEPIVPAEKTPKVKQIRAEKKARRKIKPDLPFVNTQYAFVEYTKSISRHNQYRPSSYIYGFYTVNYPKRQAYLERIDAGMTGDFRNFEAELDDVDHWDSEEEIESENFERTSLTLADFVTTNIRVERYREKKKAIHDWVFVV